MQSVRQLYCNKFSLLIACYSIKQCAYQGRSVVASSRKLPQGDRSKLHECHVHTSKCEACAGKEQQGLAAGGGLKPVPAK